MSDEERPVCVVTGASRGVGRATAIEFGRTGYDLVIAARDAAALDAVHAAVSAQGAACLAVACDLAVPGAAAGMIAKVAAWRSGIDVLVNNAGTAPRAPLEQLSRDVFDAALALNVACVYEATQSAWPLLRRRRGAVLNISSMSALDPFPGFQVYGACKAWVNTFTRAIADEGRSDGIRAYAVALGAVDTDMLRGHFPDFPAADRLTPEEVAAFLRALVEEPMRHASGQTLVFKR